MNHERIAFIGGGNMASAIIGGLIRQGLAAANITVVEPCARARQRLQSQFGLQPVAQADAALHAASLVVWAIKPQIFKDVALASKAFTAQALHLSVAAGIRSDSIAGWLGHERIVRAMPNTPALVGQGMSALFARAGVDAVQRLQVERVIATTGQYLWLEIEDQLDSVTALSGCGPAYVFYFMEAMVAAGTEMGLSPQQAQQLTLATFSGAAALAQNANTSPQLLRQQVTSKGGATFAAISSMENNAVQALFVAAMHSARQRAIELGAEFGR